MLTRLLILWILSEQPLHGYRVKKILDDPSLRFWFSVEVGSIYAVIGSLLRGGLIKCEAVEREGQRPQRTRYRITREGRSHFQDLLRQAWKELPRQSDPIDLALAAQSELEESEIAAMLAIRAQSLRERLAELQRVAASAPAPEMVDRQRAILSAELQWADKLLGTRR